MNAQPPTTTSHIPARGVAERLYASIARGDLTTVTELLHPDVVLSVPGANPVSGTYRGIAGLRQFTATTAAIAPGGAHTEVLEILGGDRYAAVYGVSSAARPGHRALRNETIHLVAVDGGKATAITIYNRDQRTVDAFWS